MIGLFDSGHGGLTIHKALSARFPGVRLVYLGDHANVPYGNRPAGEIVALTRTGVEHLFGLGCRLVVLACNTATAVACRTLQRDWLPNSRWPGRNVLGIVAPTVEAATQTPWAVTEPQYPQKFNTDIVAVFATALTVSSNVYPEEIQKRCPKARVIQQACPDLAGAIEQGADKTRLDKLVSRYVEELGQRLEGRAPDKAILGCTHYPLVEDLFSLHLPAGVRVLSQPGAVADSLEDYLARHGQFLTPEPSHEPLLLTTGDLSGITAALSALGQGYLRFRHIDSLEYKTK